MGDISWARELPEKVIINVPPTFKLGEYHERMVQMTRATFDRIDDYSRSMPTGPSPGRIYRKNHGWPSDMEDNWFVFFCVAEPPEMAPVCKRCSGRGKIRFAGREFPSDCDRCDGSGVSKPGVYHVPYIPVFVDKPIPIPAARRSQLRRKPKVAS